MKTHNFTKLIQIITGRPFVFFSWDNFCNMIPAGGDEISFDSRYFVGYNLPISGGLVGFKWKTPSSDEKMLKSFIKTFISKYREPDPESFLEPAWKDMTDTKREAAFFHRSAHMLSKEKLLEQVRASFELPEMKTALCKWGFYETNYGIGIFRLFNTVSVNQSIFAMREFLTEKEIPFGEELSEAGWVHRFMIGISKEFHKSLLENFLL